MARIRRLTQRRSRSRLAWLEWRSPFFINRIREENSMSAVMNTGIGKPPVSESPAIAEMKMAKNEVERRIAVGADAPHGGQARSAMRTALLAVVPPVLGVALMVLLWAIVSTKSSGFPPPAATGIPLGFLIGRFKFLGGMFNPVISILKPVSPLAWLPIGLMVFKAANPASIWAIFICSIWPMIINTAVGVQRVPQDYMNVARVRNLSEWKIFTKVLFPAVRPYTLTGVRLGLGVAWLVIVAAEMLTGGVGIGFWVWDEWNNLRGARGI